MVDAGPDVLVMIHGGPGMDMGYMVPDFRPLARPELASRVTGDFCSAGAEAIRSGMGVAAPHTQASLGDWDFRPGLAAVAAPTLIIHGEAEAIPMDLVEAWTTALPDAKLVKIFERDDHPDIASTLRELERLQGLQRDLQRADGPT